MLTRMLDDGWEEPNTLTEKRPPRRYYELTHAGRLVLGGVLQQARSDARFRHMNLGVGAGLSSSTSLRPGRR